MSVSLSFHFMDDSLIKYQWIFTKHGMSIAVVEYGLRLPFNGQVSSIFDWVICQQHIHILVSGLSWTWVNVNGILPKIYNNTHWYCWDLVWDGSLHQFLRELSAHDMIKGRILSFSFYFDWKLLLQYLNHVYNTTRYNDRISYNDNLTGMKPSLKRRQLIRYYV